MIIDYDKVIQERIASSVGLTSYGYIMQAVQEVNVSKDKDFQKTYNGFYRVRRNEEWRKNYYKVFEDCKGKNISFDYILKKIYKLTGNVEASFSSKLLATLDDSKPIWDHYVIDALGIKPPAQYIDNNIRIEEIIKLYDEMINWYEEYLKTDNAKEAIQKFNDLMPDYQWISDIKKVDFFLWSIR